MKKILSVKRSISLILSAAIVIASAIFTTGLSTTAEAPTMPEGTNAWNGNVDDEIEWKDGYRITNAEELAWFLKNNQDYKPCYLENDIYLNDLSSFDSWSSTAPAYNWSSLADQQTFNHITIDGQGHMIYGLYDVNADGNAGLIHELKGSYDKELTIKNLGIDYAYISGKNAAAFLSYNDANIAAPVTVSFENCFVGENVTINCPTGASGAGGFVGTSQCYQAYENKHLSFKNCYSLVNINNSENCSNYGAFAGKTLIKDITLEKCYTNNEKMFGYITPYWDRGKWGIVDPTLNYSPTALATDNKVEYAYTTACPVDNMKGIAAAISMSNLGAAYVTTDGYPILATFNTDDNAIPLGVDSVATELFGGGKGTEAEPFLISNAQQLRNAIGYFGLGQHYKLTDDIYDNNVNAVKWTDNGGEVNSGYTPNKWFNATDNADLQKYTGIGGNKGAFYGYIDGDGHAIHGIYTPFQSEWTNNAERYTYIAALIPVMESGKIENLTLSDSYLCTFAKNEGGQNKAYAGGIVGHLIGNADFEKVTVDDSVSVKLFSQNGCYDHSHGAIIGYIGGRIKVNLTDVGASCLFTQSEGYKQYFTGLVGKFWGPTIYLTNCYSKGVFPVEYNGDSTVNFVNVYTDTADTDGKGGGQTISGEPTVLESIVGNAIENPGDAWHNVIGETPMLKVRVNVVAEIDGAGSSATQEDLNALKIHLLGVEDKTNTDVNRNQVTDICDLVMLKKICG